MKADVISSRFFTALVCSVALWAGSAGPAAPADPADDANYIDAGSTEQHKGPHGGRLLRDNDLSVELQLVERGKRAEFHAWITADGDPLVAAGDANLSMELIRLGGEVERFRFSPAGEHWRSEAAIREPHSFDIHVLLIRNGERSSWRYPSHEGRVQIPDTMAKENRIETAIAGPGEIRRSLILYGRTTVAHKDVRHVRARFPGPVTEVFAHLGDRVRRGERLAVVESNDSLQSYPLTSPIDGLVIEHEVGSGEFTGDRVLFTIANYNTLWAELHVFPRQQAEIKRGQRVTLSSDQRRVETVIHDVLPGMHGQPFLLARASFDNSGKNWPPDLLVEGRVTVEKVPASVVVENRALQPYRDGFAVFVKVGETYEARPLQLGARDDRATEVLDGLEPGDHYVTANSFLIKADIEKSGASHDH
ncbi:heavy metal resistance protein CzcB [Microbulbifer flavimaris]|uniref:Heavy metal resistance protein CzcB n=1 Tax=Microbulbifer flavimaris TaxID=1781068 RepID=A0ABX4I128_9GAMM|nr:MULTISPECIES: efflux RND transporter periplasmic adaptor subunit [Microbulbifer]KUJ83937.1 hypothetical protein AVO43_08970 [Microbulbifer sp. ZGT114]PCO06114.1 heavy metal resistance protein CzcB [Microbulbifer flavimaris]